MPRLTWAVVALGVHLVRASMPTLRAPIRRHHVAAVTAAGGRSASPGDDPRGSSEEAARDARFDNTRWSFLLILEEGGQTLFTLDLEPGGAVKFANGGVDGTWQTRRDYIVVKQPTFLFGNDLYYSGRIATEAAGAGEEAMVRLTDGIVESEQSRKLVRIGKFSAHRLLASDEDEDDYEDDNDEYNSRLSRILD
jgi:hypothetical protein